MWMAVPLSLVWDSDEQYSGLIQYDENVVVRLYEKMAK